MNHYKRH